MVTAIHIEDMGSEVNAGLADDIYRDILEPSFRPDELDMPNSVLDVMAKGGSHQTLGLCALEGETPVGCVLGYPYPMSRVLLIGYLAVKPAFRSRGIGGLLMSEVTHRWYEKPEFTLVLAEIEDPRYHPAAGDIDPERRVAFYARHGVHVVVGPYFQPRLGGAGKHRVYDLFLGVMSGSSATINSGKSVHAAQLADFLVEYFRCSGEGRDWPRPDDDEGNWLLAWYRCRDAVPVHPIGAYARIGIPRLTGRL